jgi:hypothetical protein
MKTKALLLLIIIAYIIVGCTSHRVDSKRTSANIQSFLETDVNYPYIGFWKKNCSNNYGLAIEKAGDGLYAVSFCGPGGCMKSETNTFLTNDPAYRVIDDSTIEVRGKKGFSRYHRCL